MRKQMVRAEQNKSEVQSTLQLLATSISDAQQ